MDDQLMVAIAELAGALFLLAGGAVSLAAAIGVLRFPDTTTRAHAGAKPLSLGLFLAVGGLALTLRDPAVIGLLLLVVVFQILTVPVAAHMVGRVAYRSHLIDEKTLVVDELTEDLTRSGYIRSDDQ
ncbi:MAG TPA: monovalent cation/H(+) antiporter subunit G [Candidatus Avipropionibacterium avicola]|uniref:Monovalent cation/H(+) antiporter subunit G n=1 Tax=Candidatus Avipropionibacterium avicola TaxID=2840701 RepID=A0A9D1GZG4_9ACTN|nr:monovalent cation/H(+) antiporter subunit G [Candidatus Avipropionibacterium avicola]